MILLLNVGVNSSHGFRAPIYRDGSFVYIPIPEHYEVTELVNPITYRELGIGKYLPEKISEYDFAHYDPEFITFTYGHKKRYGDILAQLKKGDLLLFFATLEYSDGERGKLEEISPTWGAYIIGYFVVDRILEYKEFIERPHEYINDISNNAHLRRRDQKFDLIIIGDPDKSALLHHAVPLSNPSNPKRPNELLIEIADSSLDGPWYHRIIKCKEDKRERILQEILKRNPYLTPKLKE